MDIGWKNAQSLIWEDEHEVIEYTNIKKMDRTIFSSLSSSLEEQSEIADV